MVDLFTPELRDDFAASHAPQGFKLKDFCVIRGDAAGDDGRFHAYYIKTPRAVPNDYEFGLENMIGHSSTADFTDWRTHEPVLVALQESWERRGIIAPFVYRLPHDHPDAARTPYWMFYAGNSGRGRLGVATSGDLFAWRRHAVNPVFDPSVLTWVGRQGGGCRDPHVVRFEHDGQMRYWLYYTADGPDETSHVGCAASTDLLDWKDQGPALTAPRQYPRVGQMSCCESPSVYAIDGRYLMTVKQLHPDARFKHGSFLIWSDRPDRFDWERRTAYIDRAISLELIGRRGDALLFACFSCPQWRLHVLKLTMRGERFDVAENLTADQLQPWLD